MRHLITLVLSCLLVAPASADSIKMLMSLRKMTQNKVCTQQSDCAVAAVGKKECGGPQEYLLFSKQVTKETQLMALVRQHNQAQADERKKGEPTFSTCVVTPMPTFDCVKKVCAVTGVEKSSGKAVELK